MLACTLKHWGIALALQLQAEMGNRRFLRRRNLRLPMPKVRLWWRMEFVKEYYQYIIGLTLIQSVLGYLFSAYINNKFSGNLATLNHLLQGKLTKFNLFHTEQARRAAKIYAAMVGVTQSIEDYFDFTVKSDADIFSGDDENKQAQVLRDKIITAEAKYRKLMLASALYFDDSLVGLLMDYQTKVLAAFTSMEAFVAGSPDINGSRLDVN